MVSPQSGGASSARGQDAVACRGSRRAPGALSLGSRLLGATTRDQMAFVVAHQTHELWFNQLLCELAVLVADLDGDRLPAASRTLDRATRIAAVLAEQMRGLEALSVADGCSLDVVLASAGEPDGDPLRRLDQLAGTGAATLGRWVARERRPERPRSASVREAFVRAVLREPSEDAEVQALISSAGIQAGSALRSWLVACLERPALAAQRELSAGLRGLDEQLVTWVRQRLQPSGSGARRPALAARRFFPELWA